MNKYLEHVKKRKSEEELENGEIPEKRIKPNDLVKQVFILF